MKINTFICGAALVLAISSCGGANTTNALKQTDIPIQRKVYGLILGETYSHQRTIDSLSVYFPGIHEEDAYSPDYSWSSRGPWIQNEYNDGYVTSYVNTRAETKWFSFGNHHWEYFIFEKTDDGELFHVGFASINNGEEDNDFDFILKTLTDKYGKANIERIKDIKEYVDFHSSTEAYKHIWYDGICSVCLFKAIDAIDGKFYMQLEYFHHDIMNEIKQKNAKKGKEEL